MIRERNKIGVTVIRNTQMLHKEENRDNVQIAVIDGRANENNETELGRVGGEKERPKDRITLNDEKYDCDVTQTRISTRAHQGSLQPCLLLGSFSYSEKLAQPLSPLLTPPEEYSKKVH